MKCITPADRAAAAVRARRARAGKVTRHATAGGTPNFFGPEANYANSPLIPKFVESLPGLGSANANTAGNFIPIAVPDQTTFPGSDYYQIQLNDYFQKLLTSGGPATLLRGYQDINPAVPTSEQGNHYLGPLIIAHKDRPVRVLFKNALTGAGALDPGHVGNLFIPVDTSIMGADGPQNRATLHLHGGNTPWISDGTPHQWITPDGQRGASQQNVPDMPAPPSGSATFFWPNTQQSGRLMFYHDHAYGTTRLNVYAGSAAGYLLVDPIEDNLIAGGVLPSQGGGAYNYGIPLIIQEKTFVDPANITAQDPTWNSGSQPGTPVLGDLWYPHVYVPNQNPVDPEGVNAVGRWDYGPWFWPPQDPSSFLTTGGSGPNGTGRPYDCPGNSGYDPLVITPTCPGIPLPSITPEAFGDTPLINGQAYPYVTVQPTAYRFRILNASNDRTFNLQLYFAADTSGGGDGTPGHPGIVCKGAGNSSTCTEVNMVPAAPPSGTPVCASPTQTSKSGLALGALDGSGNPLNGTGLPAGCWPTTWPTDGRDGGVPDPSTAGPALIQIGTEGGILPSPVVIPSTPVGYEYNRKSVVVLNVSNHGLLIGPAERADVIVDFSGVPAGSTLILYNDAPAAIPAFDPRLDYYTGDPDQSPTGMAIGGAPTTMAGFGPNTRTVMQFRVAGNPTAPFNLANLTTQLQSAYASIQPVPVVPETAYNAPFPGIAAKDTYARIQDNTISFAPPVTPPPPYAGPSCTAAAGEVCAAMLPKAIQELFTLDYGRMNATLGVELPFTRFNVQTTIPYGYIDPPTEFVTEGQPQLWKITHNGVDTHFIHFHLFNVQVINRVGWDGQVRAPDANELGWKDTVRMNPLEDIVVALEPVSPAAPFPVPTSNRLLDVTMPEGAITPVNAGGVPTGPPYFTNFDPANLPTTTVNTMTNFGWEYVWHCHILGHEENDMMRPIIFTPKASVLSPVPGTGVLATSPIPFSWNANPPATSTFGSVTTNYGVSSAYLCIGSVLPNTCDLYQGTPAAATGDTVDLSSKPIADGSTVFASLFSTIGGVTLHNDYTYVIGNPVASASPTSLDFGSQLVKTASLSQPITVSSGGQAPLTVKNVTMTGLNPSDFVITNGCTVVPTGTDCTIGVAFDPTAMGARAGTLNIDTNDPTHPLLTVSLTGVGIAPVAGVSPASVTFSQPQLLNTTSASQIVTLSNTGTADMTIVNYPVTGLNASDFVQTGTNCGATLAARIGTCTINVAFQPTVTGPRSATLAISTSDPFNPTLNVPLSGTGAGPIAGVSPPSLSFGNQGVATTGAPQSITVSNTGTASMTLTGVVVTGDFVQTGSTCGTTVQAPPAANTCTISVAFAPAAAGARAGSVTITTSDSFHPTLTVSLGGTGVVPVAVLSPLSLTYPIQLENTTSPAQAVQLSNTGAWPLNIAGVVVTGANAGEFRISANSCTGSLAAGATCAVSVTFTPVVAGNRTASLTFTDNSNAVAGSVQAAALSGSATGVAVSPPVLAFGNQNLGTTSNSRTVTVTNANTAIRVITSVSITGPNAVDFLLSNGCTGTLNPGRSCNVSIRFKPSVNGVESASLSIATSDPFSPSIVPMSGTGTGPIASLSPTSWNFGTVTRGQVSAPQAFTVTNTGNGALTFSNNAFSLSGNNAAQYRLTTTAPCVGGGTLAPGASCSVTVSFAPTRNSAVGVDTATLNVRDNAPGSPQIATLTGTAQ